MDPGSIRLVRDAITREELVAIAEAQFGDMVKAAIDAVVAALVPQ